MTASVTRMRTLEQARTGKASKSQRDTSGAGSGKRMRGRFLSSKGAPERRSNRLMSPEKAVASRSTRYFARSGHSNFFSSSVKRNENLQENEERTRR